MKFKFLILKVSCLLLISTWAYAIPVWSIAADPAFPPNLTVEQTATALVKYTVTNNSTKPHQLQIKAQPGVKQNSLCVLGPRGSASARCTLELSIIGAEIPSEGIAGGPLLCQIAPDGSPNPQQCEEPCGAGRLAIQLMQTTPGTPVLTVSPSNLLLSVSGLVLDTVPSGTPRVMTITNTGSAPAIGLAVQNPTLPPDAVITSTCVGTLPVGASCTVTITPGSTGSFNASNQPCTDGFEPVPGQVLVQGTNTNQVSTDVVILGYGCVYQGGYIYALTEVNNPAQSIGGKVLSLADLDLGIVWDSSTDCLGENPGHVCAQTNATSTTNGSFLPGGNTYLIYQLLTTTGGLSPGTYAAGLCEQTTDQGYTDWYLPAICELGYQTGVADNGCGTQATPLLQNVTSNLINNPLINKEVLNLSGPYWSSTEAPALSPGEYLDAWYEYFTANSGEQDTFNKWLPHVVRCSRVF